ncbi:DUF4360 domain-containing protein [Streptomyces boncukensis]|uniref:DUF4360 domain-containing protein n=1 Tax=Streptomyces boncukensis TaxID=2711219 RepID=A0A6G4WYD3_9ACTN|nr:DUF4360 domain-containing protein [Streptomyces boncukensis]NGO70296.1 DUF4360 domain-containing protein [Streptomyces boncukensis]
MFSALLTGGAAALFASTASLHGVAAEPAETPPQKIEVSVKTVNGSGCPSGTAAVSVAPDNTAFTVTYSDYLARAGGNSDPTDIRKNCQLNLGVHIPQGFTYAVAAVDYRGFAHLNKGAKGMQKASYYFQGSSETAYQSHNFSGPTSDNWHTRDATDYSALVWAPCGEDRNFNVNSELRVSAGSSAKETSFISMDSTDGSVSTVFQLAWKKC